MTVHTTPTEKSLMAEIERLRAALRWAFDKMPTNNVADWPEDCLLLAIELDARMPNVNEQ